jgi:hypothetical protein
MNNTQDTLIDIVRATLDHNHGAIDRQSITQSVDLMSTGLDMSLDEEQLNEVTRFLEENFQITMAVGFQICQQFLPWLDAYKRDEETQSWYFWDRYRRHLLSRKFPHQVLSTMHETTDQVLDLLQNPQLPGNWDRRGLVVGDVQSGKTAHYTGLICKAADAGYKVIIVLTGMLNSLRSQTQARIEDGFVGQDIMKRSNQDFGERLVGVGKIDKGRLAITFTTRRDDFKKNIAENLGVNTGQLNETVVFVVKKNTSTLRNLRNWLDDSDIGQPLNNQPMLLIDDEADQASINTNDEDKDPTRINEQIRSLLQLFSRRCFVGYTATPFANIFIDGSAEDDLFPRDFIKTLDAPDNYVGADKIFGESSSLDILRDIDDNDVLLPLKHKIDFKPETLPDSLKEAIRVYILVLAIRRIRGHHKKHNSMMINVSRFTRFQGRLKTTINQYLSTLKDAIGNHYQSAICPPENACLNAVYTTWEKEFSQGEESWETICRNLNAGVQTTHVIEVNGSREATALDYEQYPDGWNVIAVGGFNLSRGLTLEGLVVSYFLRSSIMYDTLMQMGRWFGYRDGYADLCRIYMLPEAQDWYAHIAAASRELRQEFSRMAADGRTPEEFGLKVRTHPESLIITARNKMRSGRPAPRQVSLHGRLVETTALINTPHALDNNRQAMSRLVEKMGEYNLKKRGNYVWKDVDVSLISQFISDFNNHPRAMLTDSAPLTHYMRMLNDADGIDKWDVAVLGNIKSSGTSYNMANLSVFPEERTLSKATTTDTIVFSNSRLGSKNTQECLSLPDEVVNQIKASDQGVSKDKLFRAARTKPLLLLHLIDLQKNNEGFFGDPVVAFGISFHGSTGDTINRRRLADYRVNTVFWKNEYAFQLETDDTMDEEE